MHISRSRLLLRTSALVTCPAVMRGAVKRDSWRDGRSIAWASAPKDALEIWLGRPMLWRRKREKPVRRARRDRDLGEVETFALVAGSAAAREGAHNDRLDG